MKRPVTQGAERHPCDTKLCSNMSARRRNRSSSCRNTQNCSHQVVLLGSFSFAVGRTEHIFFIFFLCSLYTLSLIIYSAINSAASAQRHKPAVNFHDLLMLTELQSGCASGTCALAVHAPCGPGSTHLHETSVPGLRFTSRVEPAYGTHVQQCRNCI
jgi:hypothetical protein